MDICKNCKGKLLDNVHMSSERKCNNPQIMNLIGVSFMAGYFHFEVKRKVENGYSCSGRGPNKLKNKTYTYEYIVENAFFD